LGLRELLCHVTHRFGILRH